MKYRKKPVEIEARQLTPETREALSQWMNNGKSGASDNKSALLAWYYDSNGADELYIETLEEVMVARNGDWIIRGVDGEFYPCKPDIFAKTYEPATSTTTKEEAIKALRIHANNPDQEEAHYAADDVLCMLLIELGYADVVAEWHKIEKWYA